MKRSTWLSVPAMLLAILFFVSSCAFDTSDVPFTDPSNGQNADSTSTIRTDAPTDAPSEVPAPPLSMSEWVDMTGGEVRLNGEGEPDASLGESGDFYYANDLKELYYKGAEGWSLCGSPAGMGYKIITFSTNRGDVFPVQILRAGDKVKEPDLLPEDNFAGWYSDKYSRKWDFETDTVTSSAVFVGFYYDEMEGTPASLTYKDIRPRCARNEGETGMLVIFVGMTDGFEADREKFEKAFCGEYGLNESYRSVASYFGYASRGKVSFDFRFRYYDTGLTCAEAYGAVQKKHNRFLIEIFDKIRNDEPELMRALDKDGDGYVDSVAFVCGEDSSKTAGGGRRCWLFGGATTESDYAPDTSRPNIGLFMKLSYEDSIESPIVPGSVRGGMRVLLHETGHLFGVSDYYDTYPDENGGLVSTLGGFDMQERDVGEWNPYSRFCAGWAEPYAITEDTEKITLKLGSISETSDAVLIPTSKGWNGTPFDEYILIDVLAPVGTNGFDWVSASDRRSVLPNDPREKGGVRVYHVDSRLIKSYFYYPGGNTGRERFTELNTYEEILAAVRDPGLKTWKYEIWERFFNTNGAEPYLEYDPRGYHLIDLVPRDGSSKYRICTPTTWSIYTVFCYSDLFSAGDVFSMDSCRDAFPDGPYMNNGGTLDFAVRVEHYDPETREAIITITRVR